jgi:hypothetical protein
MDHKKFILAFGLMLLFFGCTGPLEEFNGTKGTYDSGSYARGMEPAIAEAPSYSGEYLGGTYYDYNEGYYEEQMVIQTGYVSVKVQEGALEEKAAAVRGYVSDVRGVYSGISYYETSTTKNYHITVKVPPSRFDEFVSKLKEMGEIKSMDTSLEDVTEQYMDIENRIANLEEELARLNELYDMAEDVEDVLAIEREVTRVQTQLEWYGQQKLDLERRSSLSTVTVHVYEEKSPVHTNLLLPLEQVLAVFFGALSFAIVFLAGALGFLIPVAIIVLVLWSIWKHLKKGNKK